MDDLIQKIVQRRLTYNIVFIMKSRACLNYLERQYAEWPTTERGGDEELKPRCIHADSADRSTHFRPHVKKSTYSLSLSLSLYIYIYIYIYIYMQIIIISFCILER